jgi:hypothetical protein
MSRTPTIPVRGARVLSRLDGETDDHHAAVRFAIAGLLAPSTDHCWIDAGKNPFGKDPLLALSAVIAVITYLTQKSAGSVEMLHVPFVIRRENALISYVVYVGKMFWPTGMAVLYPYPQTYRSGSQSARLHASPLLRSWFWSPCGPSRTWPSDGSGISGRWCPRSAWFK